ncbi:MAG: tetratricopeptide repeat protein [Desulfuromonadales bacterium]|nr:tetratricopeptide repeat protein [Desulfuromonadales bacterium]
MLKALWAAMQCGRHHGKANKYKVRGDLEKAVMHFEQALPYAERTGNSGTVAFGKECIAITYQEMKKSSEAKKYAESSLKIYRALAQGSSDDFFAEAASRVEQLLGKIGA